MAYNYLTKTFLNLRTKAAETVDGLLHLKFWQMISSLNCKSIKKLSK